MKNIFRISLRRAAFQNRYLAAAMVVISFLISATASGQLPVDTSRPRQTIYASPGYNWVGGGFEKVLRPPNDTLKLAVKDSGAIAYKNGTYWKWSGKSWSSVANVSFVNDSTLSVDGKLVKVGGSGGSGSSLDSLKQIKDTDVDNPYYADNFLYDSIAKKWKATSIYFQSLKDLLYAKDTLGVKVVKSFHRGYRTGDMHLEFRSGGVADYITSWPSKYFSGCWQTLNVTSWISVEKLGALGNLSTRITAAGLGYSSTDLTDLYGSYFTKSTTDFIDEIALSQANAALGITSKRYRFIWLSTTTYWHKKNLHELPNFTGANAFDFFGIYGNNSKIESWGGKYNVFMRNQTHYTNMANQAVNNRFIVEGIEFSNSDTAIGIHASYSSVIEHNLFRLTNVGISLKWNLATFVSNNRWDGFDSVALYIGHIAGFVDNSVNTASAYTYLINNRFFARNHAKKAIHIQEVNGVYIENSIFEGGDPDYNIYIDFTKGSFAFGTNTREMKIMGGHLENAPDSACIYFEGAGKNLYIEKFYMQMPTSSPYVWAIGDPVEGDAHVYMYNIPYWGQSKPLKSVNASWVIDDCFPLSTTFLDTASWWGGVVPANVSVKNMKGTLKMPYYYNPPASINNAVDYFTSKDFVGHARFWGTLQVPLGTDSNTFSPSPGKLFYHIGRGKFYGGLSSSWRWLLDSSGFLNPTLTATANNQILTAISYTPTFVPGSFTGLTYRYSNFQTPVAGGIIDFRLFNTSSTAGSRTRMILESNNGGIMSLYSDGRIITSGTNLTLLPHTGMSTLLQVNGSTKFSVGPTGTRVGDANAAVTDFDIAGTAAIIMAGGTTAQRHSSPSNRGLRINTDTAALESYDGSIWRAYATRDWSRGNFLSRFLGASSTATDSAAVIDRASGQLVMRPIASSGGGIGSVGSSPTTTDSAAVINRISGLLEMRPIAGGSTGGASGDGEINGGVHTFRRVSFTSNGMTSISSYTFIHHLIIRSIGAPLTNLTIGTDIGLSNIWSGPVNQDDLLNTNDINLELGSWFPNGGNLYFGGVTGTGAEVQVWLLTDKWNPPVAP